MTGPSGGTSLLRVDVFLPFQLMGFEISCLKYLCSIRQSVRQCLHSAIYCSSYIERHEVLDPCTFFVVYSSRSGFSLAVLLAQGITYAWTWTMDSVSLISISTGPKRRFTLIYAPTYNERTDQP